MKWNFLVSLILLCTSSLARQGGYSGGGGDYHSIDSGAAWFIGTQQITYCIEASNDFGLTTNEIQQSFENAVGTWKQYIRDRRIHASEPEERRLNLNFSYSAACSGQENLRIYLGVEPNEVLQAKKKFEKPYAFAIRESYDLTTGMAKGFMWFAKSGSLFPGAYAGGFPNWKNPYTLQGMMLHELGHVLGVAGHVDGTIMAEDMMSTLQFMDSKEDWARSRGQAMLTSIDDLRILYFNSNSSFKIEGGISYYNQIDVINESFKTFMDRLPVGKVKLTLSQNYSVSDSLMFELVIADEKESRTFVIQRPSALRNEFQLLGGIFGILYKDRYQTKLSYGSAGESGIGFTTTKSGKSITINYSINAEGSGGPVRLFYLDGQTQKELFYSSVRGNIL